MGSVGVWNLEQKPERSFNGVAKAGPTFDAQMLLESARVPKTISQYGRGDAIFTQGDACEHVIYIQAGGVKLSVLSRPVRRPSSRCLALATSLARDVWRASRCAWGAPWPLRHDGPDHQEGQDGQLAASAACDVRPVDGNMLARNIRIQEDLIDQLFNSSEKRLARTLLLLARYGRGPARPRRPRISQDTLAE